MTIPGKLLFSHFTQFAANMRLVSNVNLVQKDLDVKYPVYIILT